MKNLNLLAKVFSFCILISGVSSSFCMNDIRSSKEVYKLLSSPSNNCLQGVSIVLSGEKAPNFDVPSTGAGDELFYPRIFKAFFKYLGAKDIVVDLGKRYGWLKKFFNQCSEIKVFSDISEKDQKEYVKLEIRDILDLEIMEKLLSEFECKTRYLSGDHLYVEEVEKVIKSLEGLNSIVKEETGHKMIPVLFTRQSAHYEIKNDYEKKLFGYLNHRSISRENLAEILKNKPDYAKVFNIQFEDQKLEDIAGTEKPVKIYDAPRRGAFVNDAILMKAVLKVGGQIVSIDSSPAMLAIGMPDVDDVKKNIKILLGKNYNSRWKKPFVKEDGSVCWSKNVELIIQKKEDDWSYVGNKVVKNWVNLKPIRKIIEAPESDCNCLIL